MIVPVWWRLIEGISIWPSLSNVYVRYQGSANDVHPSYPLCSEDPAEQCKDWSCPIKVDTCNEDSVTSYCGHQSAAYLDDAYACLPPSSQCWRNSGPGRCRWFFLVQEHANPSSLRRLVQVEIEGWLEFQSPEPTQWTAELSSRQSTHWLTD